MAIENIARCASWRAVNYRADFVQAHAFFFEPDIVCFVSTAELSFAKRYQREPVSFAASMVRGALAQDDLHPLDNEEMHRHWSFSERREKENLQRARDLVSTARWVRDEARIRYSVGRRLGAAS